VLYVASSDNSMRFCGFRRASSRGSEPHVSCLLFTPDVRSRVRVGNSMFVLPPIYGPLMGQVGLALR
jgi:hypothetical protein